MDGSWSDGVSSSSPFCCFVVSGAGVVDGRICERSGISTTRMIRSVLLTSICRPLLVSRRSETRPDDSLVEWMILRLFVSMRLMNPFEVPAIMNVPSGEKIVAVVCCLSVVGDRSSGVVGRRCLTGLG